MMDDEAAALRARIEGLQIILAMVLNMLPDEAATRSRLVLLEETARQRNLDSETVSVLREFREQWDE